MWLTKLFTCSLSILLTMPISCMDIDRKKSLTDLLQQVMNMQYQKITKTPIFRGYTYQATHEQPTITTERDHYVENQRGKIRTLVALGANPEVKNGWGQTCLAKALEFNDYETAELTLKHGANPEASRCILLPRPLIYYVTNIKIAQLLVKHGLIIAAQTGLLHYCMDDGMFIDTISPELISYYIIQGAVVCEQKTDGDTALHALIKAMRYRYQGNFDAATIAHEEHIWLAKAECLLKASPQLLNIENKERKTPSDYITFEYPEKIDSLVKKMHALFRQYRGNHAT